MLEMKKDLILDAENFLNLSATENEKEISNIAIQFVKKLNLDDECILSSYLYYPYIKTVIYTSPADSELKLFDEVRRKQEEDKRKDR